MRSFALVLFAAFTVSGCLGDTSAPSSATSDDSPAREERTSRMGPAESKETTLELVPVDYTGMMALGVCLTSGPYSCNGATINAGRNAAWTKDLRGTPETIGLMLHWNATTPATRELVFGVHAASVTASGGGTVTYYNTVATKKGTSPVTLAVVVTEWPADRPQIMISVDSESLTPTPVHNYVHAGQEFRVFGLYTERVPT